MYKINLTNETCVTCSDYEIVGMNVRAVGVNGDVLRNEHILATRVVSIERIK